MRAGGGLNQPAPSRSPQNMVKNQKINPIFSEWKWVVLELTIPMMHHTWVSVTSKYLKSFLWCGGRVIIMSALCLSLRDKDRLGGRERLTISDAWISSGSLFFSELFINYNNMLQTFILSSLWFGRMYKCTDMSIFF